MQIDAQIETWPLARPFRITGRTYHAIDIVVVTVRDGDHVGRGEAAGVDYLGETPAAMLATIEATRDAFPTGLTRAQLHTHLPAGGARNALDCALWDLEAARSATPAWRNAGIAALKPCVTVWTIGADAPDLVERQAADFAEARAIKLKLTGDREDAARVRAVRAARPDVWLGVDGNRGFTLPALERLMPALVDARVALVEQPLPTDSDALLNDFAAPIPIAADESVQDLASLERLAPGFSMINIKLDKCGGLTEALAMVELARARGLGVMVGNMLGTSLAMAPAFIIGQFCDVVDLDGPILLQRDRPPGAIYRDGTIWCPDTVWGGGAS
ncbi:MULTISPECIES: dipeptide epimerase [unclassified Sphingomonas]|uniref:dipeptide epimerase n=1 Tax=unclassified Sphingomonas TaxID=196159 RepID=UPI00092AEA75|nr:MULTISPECIES: dipeptide epimerase [unclassified Sphingomonas]OJU16195.1 MAG: dipeptide epimerase [Sphingomonas sp. 66-10]